jgi:hypothetical protein
MARILCGGVEYRSLAHAIDTIKLSNHIIQRNILNPAMSDWCWLEPPTKPPALQTPRQKSKVSALGQMVEYPAEWPDDGGARRERVLDPDDGRLVAIVGWRSCLRCGRRFFSEDVRAIRLCPSCKGEG